MSHQVKPFNIPYLYSKNPIFQPQFRLQRWWGGTRRTEIEDCYIKTRKLYQYKIQSGLKKRSYFIFSWGWIYPKELINIKWCDQSSVESHHDNMGLICRSISLSLPYLTIVSWGSPVEYLLFFKASAVWRSSFSNITVRPYCTKIEE